MEPLKKAQVEGFLMFAEPEVLFGNLDELCSVSLIMIHSSKCRFLTKNSTPILKTFLVFLGHPLLLQRVSSGPLDPFRR